MIVYRQYKHKYILQNKNRYLPAYFTCSPTAYTVEKMGGSGKNGFKRILRISRLIKHFPLSLSTKRPEMLKGNAGLTSLTLQPDFDITF